MPSKGGAIVDKFGNVAAAYLTQTGADVDIFSSFNFPFSIMDKVGLIISRIEYIAGTLAALNGTTDFFSCGICCASTLADPTDTADALLVDLYRVNRIDMGAAASGMFFEQPFIKDFSSLPGGGILVPPAPLYAFVHTSGANAAMSLRLRMFYTYMNLDTADYWQLVESRRVVTTI